MLKQVIQIIAKNAENIYHPRGGKLTVSKFATDFYELISSKTQSSNSSLSNILVRRYSKAGK
jgi:hypothetical protein